MKVVGIIGGPRLNGNTYNLMRAVLDGALDAGHTVVTYRLRDFYIGHIGAFDNEITLPLDDFEKMREDLESMGALVIGSPIFYGHVDTRTMTWINRTYEYNRSYSEENAEKWPKVKVVNIITYEKKEEDAYDHIFDWYKEIWDWYGVTEIINLAAPGTSENPVENRAGLLSEAKEIGRTL